MSADSAELAFPYPAVIAHRGAGRLAPENTLAAIRLGASLGHRMFEVDVKLSAEGVPVLMHDDTLDRTTSGHGPVARHDLAALRALDAGAWFDARFLGEKIPTLDEVTREVIARDLRINLEVKPCPGRAVETGAVVAAAARAGWAGRAALPLISSFSEEALGAVRAAAPELPRALLVDAVSDESLRSALSLGCVALNVRHRALDAALVARVRALGLRVLAWTANDPARAEALWAMGVAGVITDAVERLRPVTRAR